MDPHEVVLRLKKALAKSVADSYKVELRKILESKTQELPEHLQRFKADLNSIHAFTKLHDYMDANMIPPQSEWIMGRPLVSGQFDPEGVELACDVMNRAQSIVNHWIVGGGLLEKANG